MHCECTCKPDPVIMVIPFQRLLMKIPDNQPIFYLWPIQKLLHFGIPDRAIPAIYGGSALYMVVMQRVG